MSNTKTELLAELQQIRKILFDVPEVETCITLDKLDIPQDIISNIRELDDVINEAVWMIDDILGKE